MRPDVVWFGEMPYRMEEIYAALARCDLFVSIGTSGTVYPAAGFVAEARAAGAHTVELNLEPSEGQRACSPNTTASGTGDRRSCQRAFIERFLFTQAESIKSLRHLPDTRRLLSSPIGRVCEMPTYYMKRWPTSAVLDAVRGRSHGQATKARIADVSSGVRASHEFGKGC